MTVKTNKLTSDGPLAVQLLRIAMPESAAQGFDNFSVTGITSDSRQVKAGHIFVAIPGLTADGADFAHQAAASGAKLVLTHRRIDDLPCPQVVVADTRRVAAKLAGAFYGLDELFDRQLKLIGVTGTNGKTTVTYALQHICSRLGTKTARLGTIDYDLIDRTVQATHTTPDPIELARLIRQAYDSGAQAVAMEVSSHALSQARISGLKFATAVFTNLSGDHLDYHGTMQAYLDAKLLLFKGLADSSWAVVNIDDKYSEQIIASTGANVLTFGIDRADATLNAKNAELNRQGGRFDLVCGGIAVPVSVPYLGRHNVYNILAAVGAAVSIGEDVETIAATLKDLPSVPGRLERIDHRGDFDVSVDYAHTDDGLANVLDSLKAVVRGRLIVVFGCGGDRDRAKRPRMAAVAERLADKVVVTSDNPRTESADAIIADILIGFSKGSLGKVHVEPDRAVAIREALTQARSGDMVLIAGKGHEPYQFIGDRRIAFDDRDVARATLRSLQLLD